MCIASVFSAGVATLLLPAGFATTRVLSFRGHRFAKHIWVPKTFKTVKQPNKFLFYTVSILYLMVFVLQQWPASVPAQL